jgi:hypothetical protein
MDARLSRHRTPRRTRREILLPALLLLLALAVPAATPPPAHAQGAGADSVTLHWTAPGDDGDVGTAQSYEMRMSLSAITENSWASATVVPGAPAPLAAGTRQSMVVRGLTNGVVYFFAMKATDEAGNVAPLSNVVRWDWILDTAPPQAPSGLAGSAQSSTRVLLTWSPNAEPDLATYTVYRTLESGGLYEVVATGLTNPEYVDSGIPDGIANAWYRVTATDQSGNESAYSGAVSVALASSSAPATTWNLKPAYPNPGPLSAPVNIPIDVPPAGPGSAYLQIVDGGGHLIRRIDLSSIGAGAQTVTWDGRNQSGLLVSPGVYTAWLRGGDAAKSLKIVRVP